MNKNLKGWLVIAVTLAALLIAGKLSLLVRYRNLFVVALMLVCLAIVLFMGDWKDVDEKEMEE